MQTPQQYYHQPIVITDDVRRGAGKAVWRGLCAFLEETTGLTEPEEALYLADNTPDAIAEAVDQAVREMVPSIIVLEGDAAAQAVQQLQSTYRGTFFLVLNGRVEQPAENTCCVRFAAEQAGFLAGYAAACDGFTSVWFTAGENTPQSSLLLAGFVQGAELAAQTTRTPVQVCQGFPQPPEGTDLIFSCGSRAEQEQAVERAAELGLPIICTGSDFSDLYSQNPAASPILTSAYFHVDAITETILRDWAAGGWAQFYGGKELTYDLQWGEAVGLSTEDWGFTRFSVDLYRQAAANVQHGAYPVSQTLPSGLTWVTLVEHEEQ